MRTPILLLSSLTVSTVLAAQTSGIQVAQAGASKVSAEAVVQLNIPAGDLMDALKALAKQTGIDLVYLPKQLAGRQTQGIKGELTVQDALRRLLEGTALRADTDVDSGAILISEPEPAARSIVEDASGLLDEVLVSRRRPFTDGNMDIVRTSDDAQAYQIIGKQDIEKSGAADVESFLKKHLSMNTAAQLGTQSSISTGGATTINLRGIGANQTLILINGRRTANTASFGAADQPDVRSIPLGAVERIEVLPVSSSAIYGGSAIGGVVNVVLKRDLEGGQVGVSYRTPFDVHAPMRTVDASYGTSLEDGRTHLMAAIRYSDSKSPRSRDRPELFERGLQTVLRNNPALLTSPTSPYRGGTTPNIGSADGSELVLKPEYGGMGLGSNITHIPLGVSGVTAPLDLGAGLLANAGSYNFSPVSAVGSFQGLGLSSPIHGEPETKSIIASARRRMTDNVELFAEFYHSTYRLATDWAAYNLPVTVSAASPVNPFRQNVRITLLPTVADQDELYSKNEVTRFTGGALVDLPNDWQLESDYTLTRNQSTFSSFGLHTQNLPAAINSGTVDPFVDTLANPLNMAFYGGAYGGDFPSRLGNVALRVAGPLGHLPAGRPTLTIGLEHRKESLDAGDYYWAFPQFPSRNVQRYYLPKSQRVLSAYAEMKVPLVSAANSLPLVRELDLQISGRSERFKVATGTAFVTSPTEPVTENEASFSATSPTIGVRFKPFEQLMLRASYATGFLPPDYVQFLAPTLGGGFVSGPGSLTSVVDPRRGNEVVATQFMAGGNPNIEPQNSTSWSVGAVWTPQYLKGLRANLEWYRLTLKDVALTPTAQQIVDLESQFQGRIQRDAVAPGDPYGVGRISLVDYSLINAASTKTEGLDMSIAYRFGIGSLGSLEFSGIGTVIKHFQRQTTLGGPMVDIVNQVANGGPLQRKGNLSLSWWREAWQVDWTLTHFGSYQQSDNPAFVLAQGSRSIPSQSYHDLVVKYDWDAGLTVQVGVSNVFNDVPPLDVFYDRTSYYSPFGDARLREYWLSLNQRF